MDLQQKLYVAGCEAANARLAYTKRNADVAVYGRGIFGHRAWLRTRAQRRLIDARRALELAESAIRAQRHDEEVLAGEPEGGRGE